VKVITLTSTPSNCTLAAGVPADGAGVGVASPRRQAASSALPHATSLVPRKCRRESFLVMVQPSSSN